MVSKRCFNFHRSRKYYLSNFNLQKNIWFSSVPNRAF
nr:MAG TPA: hypothetical protein [Caudoviricetes sp.]